MFLVLASCLLTGTGSVLPSVAESGSLRAEAGLRAEDWRELRAVYERSRHAILPRAGLHQARNPGQRWGLTFDDRGFLVEPTGGGWAWGLELTSYGFAGSERRVERPQAVCADGGRLTYAWDECVEEWYVNDTRGLEHGFTLHERPESSGADGELVFELRVRGDLRAEVVPDGRAVDFVAHGAPVVTYSGLTVYDADGVEWPASFEASGPTLTLTVSEEGARYPLTIDPVALQAYLKASNTDAGDQFGQTVAVWGDTVAVGAPSEDSSATGVNGNQADNNSEDSGAVYVFRRSGTTWTQEAYLKASNAEPFDRFGTGLALHGDTLAVGTPYEASGLPGVPSDNSAESAGAAYVFRRSGTAWTQEAYLKASHPDPVDWFGWKLSLSGDTLAIGAALEDSSDGGIDGDESDDSLADAGAAYVFVRDAGIWTQQAYIKPAVTGQGHLFGTSVALDAQTLVVGSQGDRSSATGVDGDATDTSLDHAGAAHVFTRSGSTWSQQAYLKASNTDHGDVFGVSVSVAGDTVAVGATGESSDADGIGGDQGNAPNQEYDMGAAYVFERSGTSWAQVAYVKAFQSIVGERFGAFVALDGDTLAVGSYGVQGCDSYGMNCFALPGTAYLYRRSQGSWSEDVLVDDSWDVSTYPSSNGFGGLGGLLRNTLVMGIPGDDSNATGVNGDQDNDDANGSGAAYVIELPDPLDVCTSLPNATGSVAQLQCLGVPSSSLTLVSSPVPNTVGQFFYGAVMLAGNPFGDGLLCVGGMTQRLLPYVTGGMMSASNTAVFSVNYSAPYAAGLTGTRHFQYWFRSGLATGAGFNTSSSATITF